MTDAFVTAEPFPDGHEYWMEGDIAARKLDGDEWLVIRPMILSLRLAVMTEGDASVEHWCFTTLADAFVAWCLYPQVPQVWTRHIDRNGDHEWPTND